MGKLENLNFEQKMKKYKINGRKHAGNIGTRTKRHFTIGANHPLQRNLPESRLD